MSKTLSYALGGALVGAILGAAMGVGASRMRQSLPEGSSGAVKRPLDMNRSFQLGMSIFSVIRQILELVR
ncbi:MAG: hypothetical protein ACYC6L_06890 [Anaerolineae bacterium]